MTLVGDIEIQNWAAELENPEACHLKVCMLMISL